MKTFLGVLTTCLLLAAVYLPAAEKAPIDCPCKNCKCTPESHCGCFSGKGCQCKECSYDCDCSHAKKNEKEESSLRAQ